MENKILVYRSQGAPVSQISPALSFVVNSHNRVMKIFMALMLVGLVGDRISSHRVCDGIVPENDLRIGISAFASGISERDFNDVLDRVETIYRPIVSRAGGQLVVDRYWNEDIVNAYAERDGRKYYLKMYGGFARHPMMTKDAFALTACHEIGHHIGGWPRKDREYWASVEGQADYFAPTKCLRRYFEREDNEAWVASHDVPKIVTDRCDRYFDSREAALCARSVMAGNDMAQFFVSIRQGLWANLDTPDDGVVNETFISHPLAQCRLDTYFAAAVCPVDKGENFDANDSRPGSCEPFPAWREGQRPRCWYYPES